MLTMTHAIMTPTRISEPRIDDRRLPSSGKGCGRAPRNLYSGNLLDCSISPLYQGELRS